MTYICPCFKYFTYNMHEKYSNLHFGFLQTVVWKGLNLMGFLTLRERKFSLLLKYLLPIYIAKIYCIIRLCLEIETCDGFDCVASASVLYHYHSLSQCMTAAHLLSCQLCLFTSEAQLFFLPPTNLIT